MGKKDLQKLLQGIAARAQQCLEILEEGAAASNNIGIAETRGVIRRTDHRKSLDFNSNPRAFFKKYTHGLPGPKKFVLVVAYIAKGRTSVVVPFGQIQKIWDSNRGALGGGKLTSRTYGTRAKEKDWVESPKYGSYRLTDKWREASI